MEGQLVYEVGVIELIFHSIDGTSSPIVWYTRREGDNQSTSM